VPRAIAGCNRQASCLISWWSSRMTAFWTRLRWHCELAGKSGKNRTAPRIIRGQ
jgi:hypothetical protein